MEDKKNNLIQKIKEIVQTYDDCVFNVDMDVDSSPVLHNIGSVVVTTEGYFDYGVMVYFSQNSEVVANTVVDYESLPLETLEEIFEIISK